MATQSFMKNFTVHKRDAQKLARVINSKKKNFFEKDYTDEDIKKEKIREFLGVKSHGSL